ncbi:MAG: hypothetical protein D6675_04500 [Gemmatimonadetes bacterium]|nr:MAG: hypothetical protein D6675_04500 [Gemmatimonadota bacterium]
MMRYFSLIVLSVLLITPSWLGAQETELTIGGQLRVRGESIDKDFNSDTDPYDVTALRTRINIKATSPQGWLAFVQLQDSRIYGTEASTLSSTANVDLHQAYFQVNRLWWDWLSIKMGRMEMVYGNERLIGAVGWHNVGRSFDGGVAMLSFGKVQIDLFNTQLYESNQAPDENDGDQTFSGVYTQIKPADNYAIDVYVLAEQDAQENADEDALLERATIGTYFKGNFGGLNLKAELAFQGGTTNFGDTDIAAGMLTVFAMYKFNHHLKPFVGLGMDILTGDDPETEEYECFDTLYATNHKFYGFMDYFTNIPVNTQNKGLVDIMLKSGFTPRENLLFKGDLHLFSLAQDALLSDGTEETALGTEIDLTLIYTYNANIRFTGGISAFSPGDVFKDWYGEDASGWVYGQTIVNF